MARVGFRSKILNSTLEVSVPFEEVDPFRRVEMASWQKGIVTSLNESWLTIDPPPPLARLFDTEHSLVDQGVGWRLVW